MDIDERLKRVESCVDNLSYRVGQLEETDKDLYDVLKSVLTKLEHFTQVVGESNESIVRLTERVGWLLRLSNVLATLFGVGLGWVLSNWKDIIAAVDFISHQR